MDSTKWPRGSIKSRPEIVILAGGRFSQAQQAVSAGLYPILPRDRLGRPTVISSLLTSAIATRITTAGWVVRIGVAGLLT